jgi:hypothetical protein
VADIRTLKLALLADTAQFSSGMNQAGKDTDDFNTKVGNFAKAAGAAFLALGAAAATAAVKIGIDGVKAAMEDEKAQISLAQTLRNTTKATDGQIKKVEEYIDSTQRATGVADDKLRPSLDRLIRSTKDITEAQKLQTLALDIAAGTGKDLSVITEGLSKLYDGNFGALKKLGVPLDETIVKNKDLDAALKILSETFAGQADAAANTFTGKMDILKVKMGEVKETIGYALIDPLTKLADKFQESILPRIEDFVAGLTGGQPNSMKNALRDAKGRVEETSSGIDQPGTNGGYSLGAAIRRLTESIALMNEGLLTATGSESGLTKFLNLLTSVVDKIESAISAYDRFRGTALGGLALDIANLTNPAALGSRFATGGAGNIIQFPNTAANLQGQNITLNISGAVDKIGTARTVVTALNSAAKQGTANKLAANASLR